MITAMRKATTILAGCAALTLSACGNPEPAAESDQAAAQTATAEPGPASAPAKAKTRTDFDQAAAATLYAEKCAACHQAKGEGMAGVYPAFPGNALVNGPADPLLKVILEGRGGMPSFLGDMTPEETALVTNHLRNEWSSQSDLITADQVKTIAAGLNKASGDSRKDD